MTHTYHNGKGKVVGQIVDGIFRKKVDKRKHLMKMFDAWGIDETIFLDLEERGCTEIRIKETTTGTIYTTTPLNFKQNSITRDFDGVQMFLPLKHWTIEDSKNMKLI